MKVAGLFAGIGGFELGLGRAGHEACLFVEVDEGARAVLAGRFPEVERRGDIRALRSLPGEVELLAAGFPCQDLSQAGQTRGLEGDKSSLVGEVFRLLRRKRAPWVVLENVPFMLRLNRGAAIRQVAGELEALGYAWAYRTLDTRGFGLPQRRERVFLVASRVEHPGRLLFQTSAAPRWPEEPAGRACGFYWTEGLRGLGWAVDALPPLKGGSTVGIPSPPAYWHPDGGFYTPNLRDAERLQGFAAGWTEPLEAAGGRGSLRWKLVGNAVSVPVAEWVGRQLAGAGGPLPEGTGPLPDEAGWPAAGWGERGRRRAVECTKYPVERPTPPLLEFLAHAPRELSMKAAAGFLSRLERSSLHYPREFRRDLERHVSAARARAQRA